jgi:hypothetical protein
MRRAAYRLGKAIGFVELFIFGVPKTAPKKTKKNLKSSVVKMRGKLLFFHDKAGQA